MHKQLIYNIRCSIVVDVSYSSVLGDIVWRGNGLKSECIASVSLVLWCSSPVPVLYCNSRGFILHYRKNGEGAIGDLVV